MRALQVHALEPDFAGVRLSDVAVPQPQAGEVRVKVAAAAVNFPDLLMTRGAYQLKPPLPFTQGLEFSGVVDAVGPNVTAWRVGDEVMGGNAQGHGAMAEYAIGQALKMRRKPSGLNWEEASAYAVTYVSAYVGLMQCAKVQPGEWVLVHGAAGGVGLAAVDMAKALGARVIAAASTEEKRQAIARIYAPDAVISSEAGFREEVKRITGGAGADVIFDPVGGDIFDESTRCIAFGGRLLVVGFTSGRIATMATNIALIKGFSVMGVRAGEYCRRFPDRGQLCYSAIDRMAEAGVIRPHIDRVLDLADWREGYELLDQRKVVGKVVLRP